MKQNLGPFDEIIGSVGDDLPKFNDFLLLEFRKREVNKSRQFIDKVFREAVATKPYDNVIRYKGYRVLAPEERIAFTIDNPLTRGRYNIQRSEWELLQYIFEFESKEYYVYLYLPYMVDNAIIINDTHHYIQLAIIERVIHRVREGVTIKVLRSPLHFWRNEMITFKSIDGEIHHESVIATKAFHKSGHRIRKKDMKSTVLLYLLCQYGYDNTITRFGYTEDDIRLSETPVQNEARWKCFACKPKCFIIVDREKFNEDIILRRVVASLLYMLKFFVTGADSFNIADLRDPAANYWFVILGKYCYGMNKAPSIAISNAKLHLSSVSTYLDIMTKTSLSRMGIECNDIFDMFFQVFCNLDNWLVNHQPNNLYEKKIGVLESLLSEVVKITFKKFYEQSRKQKVITEKSVEAMLRMPQKTAAKIHTCSMVRSNPPIYNSNWGLSIGFKKVRERANQNKSSRGTNLLKSAEHKLHPSMCVVESIMAIPSSSPGVAGTINPFCEIDEDGNILTVPWAQDVEELASAIPQ